MISFSLCFLCSNISFNLGFEEAFLTLLVYPLGILPFTYVTSFAFQSSSVGQSLTLFFNFLFLLILPVSVHWIRLLEEFEKHGDFFNQLFKIHPSYCLAASLFFDNAGEKVYESRMESFGNGDPVSNDYWHIANIKGDFSILLCHCLIWFIMLTLIEVNQGVSKCCRKRRTFGNTPQNKIVSEETIAAVDDDVLEEAQRVSSSTPEDFQIKV